MNPRNHVASPLPGETLALLLEEISAMAGSGRSLATGFADLESAAMGTLGSAAKEIQGQLALGRSAEDSVASLSKTYADPIRTAMGLLLSTGSISPILETSRLIRDDQTARHQLWLATLSPMLNVAVAATVLFFVMPWILIATSRLDPIETRLSPTAVEIGQTFATNFALAGLVTAVAVGFVWFVLLMLIQLTNRRVAHQQNMATFCRWLAMQSKYPIESSNAIESSAKIVGVDFLDSWKPVVQSIRKGNQSQSSLSIPIETPEPVAQCVVDWVSRRRNIDEIREDLRILSEMYWQQANLRRTFWVEAIPRWIAAAIMLAMIILIVLSVITPMLDALGDQSR